MLCKNPTFLGKQGVECNKKYKWLLLSLVIICSIECSGVIYENYPIWKKEITGAYVLGQQKSTFAKKAPSNYMVRVMMAILRIRKHLQRQIAHWFKK